MGRVLVGVLLFCVVLPYFWFAGLTTSSSSAAGPGESLQAAQAAPSAPYVLLNESRPLTANADGDLHGGLDGDPEALLDLRPFRWLHDGRDPSTPWTCAPLVLAVVHSAVDHIDKRNAIRHTWASWARRDVLVRFMVGVPSASGPSGQQARLDAEAATFGDLVQGSFVDSYRNMTYKHVMALKWFVAHCPDATYVLKLDDDVLVNTPVLLDFVRGALSPHGARDLLACEPMIGGIVKRSWRSKWRVNYQEYPGREYPTYCFGYAVLYSPDVALRLYREAQRSAYFWIDDVQVTGVLAARLGLTHTSWEPLLLQVQDLERVLDGSLRPTFMIALLEEMELQAGPLWRRVLQDRHRHADPSASPSPPETVFRQSGSE